jgi:hypothetical protein
MKAVFAVAVSMVIPEFTGDTVCVKVLFPIPPVTEYASEVVAVPTLVVSVESPEIASAVEY